MYLTGFADEAGDDLETQIRATQALGWKYIEARKVNGVILHEMPEAAFDRVCEQLDAAGISVNCLGSTIANWGKRIDEPFDSSLAETRRAIPRMKRLGTKLVRIMSFAVLKNRGPDDQMEEERFRRLRELTVLFRDAGLIPVHENCMNYGGMGWTYTRKLLDRVPGLKLVFDTGNPLFAQDRSASPPKPRQSSWDFYTHVRDAVVYVHIKDARWDDKLGKPECTWPGEGHGDVRRIVKDLLDGGYDGGFSMEPHMQVVFHETGSGGKAQARFDTYVEYGRRFMTLLSEIGHPWSAAKESVNAPA